MPKLERQQEKRPDPDALLALAEREGRGRLKVFLGAAPGVGKTYAMLSGAKRLTQDGVDVVIGLVETHGRQETAALVEGLEVLPLSTSDYRGRTLTEFDVDAAIVRHPKLIIVDELAHTNAPESRHPKRYQDIDELLGAGIDVWTALNIQHLESLADVVSRITGVAIRETVPDTVLQTADEVVLVDITPAELIDRLKDGKIYLPDNARRAADGFFKPGNLTALRELALRRTADRVDDQMVDYLRQNAIEGLWAVSDRLLVCIGSDALSERVVRDAARLASGLNAGWLAIHVERPGHETNDAGVIRQLDRNERLAERLGGETRRLSGNDFPDEILRCARAENVSQIIIGNRAPARRLGFRRMSLAETILRRSDEIAVHVVTQSGRSLAETHSLGDRMRAWLAGRRLVGSAAVAVTAVAAAVAIGVLLRIWLPLPNLSMIFLAAVLVSALTFGLVSAIGASFLSFLAYNYVFIEPRYTFTIAEPHELFALLIFLGVAIGTGTLAGRARDQAEIVRRRARASQALSVFSRTLSGTADLESVLTVSATQLHSTLGFKVVYLLPADDRLAVTVSWPPEDRLDPGETTAALWAFEKREPAGWRTGTLPNIRFQFRPMLSTGGVLGVCGFEPLDRAEPLSASDEQALAAILDQTVVAVDRSRLVGETTQAAAREDNERLRATLLSSLSHDLRTPLASILGAVTTLRQFGGSMPPATSADLLLSIEEEAARLSRFVANMLDMSRIETGELDARRDWVDVGDVIGAAIKRGRSIFPNRPIVSSLADKLPLVRGDAILLGQVLFNLLDNANKYAGSGTPTTIHARREGSDIVISVTDQGVGIASEDLETVFTKFYRGGSADGREAGTGLGLSICRGLVEAMGGTITAQSPAVKRRGTRILIHLPAGQADVGDPVPTEVTDVAPIGSHPAPEVPS